MREGAIGCFNTSHVVIYQKFRYFQKHNNKFQYISCCYLSNQILQNYEHIHQFQYISCCYLSKADHGKKSLEECFNTSHVVIYRKQALDTTEQAVRFQYISCCYLSLFRCKASHNNKRFNTSHVVIYRYDR